MPRRGSPRRTGRFVRPSRKAINLFSYAVNKVDSEKHENLAVDFYGLGVEIVFPVSAWTGFGSDDLVEALLSTIPPNPEIDREFDEEVDEDTPRRQLCRELRW